MKNVVAVLFRKNQSLLYKIEYDKYDDSCERIKNKKKTDVNNVNILRLITIDLYKTSHVLNNSHKESEIILILFCFLKIFRQN